MKRTGARVIGIDIGTSHIAGVKLDTRDSRVLDVVTIKNDAHLPQGKPWENLQDPLRIFRLVTKLLKKLLDPEVTGLGLTGQMHGILYVDSIGQALSPLYTWLDGRGDLEVRPGVSYAHDISEVLGQSLSTGYGVVTHYYNSRQRLVPENTEGLMTITDWVARKLCGTSKPLTEATNAAAVGGYSVQEGHYLPVLNDLFPLPADFFPGIVPSCSTVGRLNENIQVLAPIGDNQAGFIGSVHDKQTNVHINIGTSSQLNVFINTYKTVSGFDTRPFPGGGYLLVGAGLCGGQSYEILQKFFQEVVNTFTDSKVKIDYKQMDSVVGRKGFEPMLHADTRLSGSRENRNIYGSINGITLNNFTVSELLASFSEGVVDELFDFYDRLPAAVRGRFKTITGTGNAVERGLYLQDYTEKLFQLPLDISTLSEKAATGAAINTARGLGLIDPSAGL